jgi:hypothetical protein
MNHGNGKTWTDMVRSKKMEHMSMYKALHHKRSAENIWSKRSEKEALISLFIARYCGHVGNQ